MLRSILTFASLLLFAPHLSATSSAAAKPAHLASVHSSSDNNEDDSRQDTDSDNPQPVAAAKGSAVTRREPKTLTPMGAVGLIVMIGIMGFFTVWALRSSSLESAEKKRADDNDDAQQA
ncbi:MAG: hypothetical protein AAF320_04030 [Myxococcota bacterium]